MRPWTAVRVPEILLHERIDVSHALSFVCSGDPEQMKRNAEKEVDALREKVLALSLDAAGLPRMYARTMKTMQTVPILLEKKVEMPTAEHCIPEQQVLIVPTEGMSKVHFDALPSIMATSLDPFVRRSNSHQCYDVRDSNSGAYLGSFSATRYKMHFHSTGYALEILSYYSAFPTSAEDARVKCSIQSLCRKNVPESMPCWIFMQLGCGNGWYNVVDRSSFADALVFQSHLRYRTELWMDRVAGAVCC